MKGKRLIAFLGLCITTLLPMTGFSEAPDFLKQLLDSKGIKKIAVIPPVDGNNYVFAFLKKEGLDKVYVQYLTPQEYVDPNIFNAKNFKVAIYAGYEKYNQTVKTLGDGDKALQSFTAQGGKLLVLGSGPLPFYSNEKDVVVNSIGMFGINVVMGKEDMVNTVYGFEKPPAGLTFVFNVQKPLKETGVTLQDKMVFPSKGDLRWRPTVNKTGSKAYIPLITLNDEQGNSLGDGAAYINGVVYVWSQLTQLEALSRDNVIRAVLAYAIKGDNLPREVRKQAVSSEKITALASRFKRGKIALLPTAGATPIEAFLVKSGIAYDKLTWEDVASADKYNVKNYPISIYAGGERYRSTVKVFADVDQALIKYLTDAGMLIVASQDPWPMYLNEEDEAVRATGKFGLPICGMDAEGHSPSDPNVTGFERPHPEINYNFITNKNKMPDLQAKVSYPAGGDQRWRPITGKGLPQNDEYTSLIELSDVDGNSYGDAAAYVNHKVSEPVGAKDLYIWSRTPDLFDSTVFFYDIFSFVADTMRY